VHTDFEKVLDKLKPSIRNAEKRYLRAVLNFGIKRGLLETNPVDRLDFADVAHKEVQVIPVDVVQNGGCQNT
jgi:hypothetical protein